MATSSPVWAMQATVFSAQSNVFSAKRPLMGAFLRLQAAYGLKKHRILEKFDVLPV